MARDAKAWFSVGAGNFPHEPGEKRMSPSDCDYKMTRDQIMNVMIVLQDEGVTGSPEEVAAVAYEVSDRLGTPSPEDCHTPYEGILAALTASSGTEDGSILAANAAKGIIAVADWAGWLAD